MQVNLVTWAVNVLGAVDITAVPRRVLTRARQSHNVTAHRYESVLFVHHYCHVYT